MPRPRHPALSGALLATLVITACLPALAQSQVRRCTTADGGTVYTDRSCAALNAVETRRPQGTRGTTAGTWRGGCSRSLQGLVLEVTAAIDSGDANRLALSYDFTGLSTQGGYAVVDRLRAIAGRPLLNIAALRPPEPVVAPLPATPGVPPGPTGAAALVLPGPSPDGIAPTPPTPRPPVALRIDQSMADGYTPSTTTFGLRKRMDCWWITL